jgi:L-ascorbate metabolism protein UlaG (beta-lactamase superfamily)
VTTLGLGLLIPKHILAREERPSPSFFSRMMKDHAVADPPERPDPRSWDPGTITAAWIGHATVLINFFGTTILTDPVFSEKIGINILGMATLGPKRLVRPALSIEELPPLDLILLSHAHMDHLDFPSLRRLNKNTPVIMAKNTSDLIIRRGWKSVAELDWGETTAMAGVTIEAFQTRHFGWRFPWEPDRSRGAWTGRSFNAYLISKNGRHILFGGDTAYQEFFKPLAERNITIDLAMMPIGAYDPWIRVHASPEQAVEMANHMNAKAILPLHWNTFTLSNEPQREPIERLKKALEKHSPSLALDDTGKTWKLPKG